MTRGVVMRGMLIVSLLVAGACARGLYGEDASASAADNETVPAHLNRPQDFAPAEMIIVPRPPEEYLPEGSLLSTGVRDKRQVDLEELHRRKIEMYGGTSVTDGLPSASGAGPSPALASRTPARTPGADYGALVFWALVAACVTASVGLIVHVLLGLKARAAARREQTRPAGER